jgi:RimJ/RimL family protein N-acetyltransferase
VLTERLELRLPVEADRARFVELFCDRDFMEFSAGVLDPAAANERFDSMLANARDLPFAKQPIIERAANTIVGYTGVAWFEYEDEQRLEYGYRLVPEARGKGYATEAGLALLELAGETFHGEVLAMVDPRNTASQAVIRKLGFEHWKRTLVEGYVDDLFRRRFP